MKTVVVGGGSSYTPTLVKEISDRSRSLMCDELTLMDIDSGRLDTVSSFCQRMIGDCPPRLKKTVDLDDALAGADVVITTIRVGGLRARSQDIRICNRLDLIGQETVGGGGLAMSLRTIPPIVDLVNRMQARCPDAWLINGTNPDGLITRAIHRAGYRKCVGLCDIPFHQQLFLADHFGVDRRSITFDSFGLNHLSWIERIYVDSEDRTDDFWASFDESTYLSRATNIPGQRFPDGFLSRLRLLPSPYLNYFYFPEEILRMQKASPRNRADVCLDIEEELFNAYRDPACREIPSVMAGRGGARFCEVIIDLVESLLSDRHDTQVVCVRNEGTIGDLPPDSVVEVPCAIRSEGPEPTRRYSLPAEVRGLVSAIDCYESLVIEGVFRHDIALVRAALLNHPLVFSVRSSTRLLDAILDTYAADVEGMFNGRG